MIRVLHGLRDLTEHDSEDAPYFPAFWRDAGLAKQIAYVMRTPSSRKRDEVVAHARRVRGQTQYGPELMQAVDALLSSS